MVSSENVFEPVALRSHWWELLPFSTHDIELSPGLSTLPGGGVVAARDYRLRVAVQACGGSLVGKTIIDLGCLEGGFSVAFARCGAKHVVGVEARSLSVERCELTRRLLGLENLEFVHGDALSELEGNPQGFDLIFMSGLLYHLANPALLLEAARRGSRGAVLIDTHVAGREGPSHGCSADTVTLTHRGRTYQGRAFAEFPADESREMRESLLWASWGDATSFWPFREDLERLLADSGFTEVGRLEPEPAAPWAVDRENRVLYVCK